MPACESRHAPSPELSDRELEVLRLLASGHTIKSIAARIDCTEGSVNERLRDARRKTGFGSSRELARTLADQKTWDTKIGLAYDAGLSEPSFRSPHTETKQTKGKLAMIVAIPIAAAALVALASTSGDVSSAQEVEQAGPLARSPLMGTWSLDVEGIPADERPARVTIVFADAGGEALATRVEVEGLDGTVRTAESTARFDGVPVRVAGTMDFIDTAALRRPSPGTLVMTLAKNGVPLSTRIYTVSKDHRSMTETIVWAGQAMPKLETTRFRRVG